MGRMDNACSLHHFVHAQVAAFCCFVTMLGIVLLVFFALQAFYGLGLRGFSIVWQNKANQAGQLHFIIHARQSLLV